HEFKNVYVVSWTTTPWTLPGNVALAVGENIEYTVTEKGGETLIVAAESPLGKQLGHVGIHVRGSELVSLRYEPLFDIAPLKKEKTAYKIYPADFVTTEDGTGVVHTAVMYGEEDYQLGKEVGLPAYHTVDEEGKFTKDVPGFGGAYVKAEETTEKIFRHLEKEGYFFKEEKYSHEYPHCWRCGTPVLYYARTSWFIGMSKLRDELLARNNTVNWMPAHVKDGRFGEWLREVKDWNLSRERYWGTPLPLWVCDRCGETRAVGSYAELSEAQGSARNRYLFMRHGESISNLKPESNTEARDKDKFALTLRGRVEAEKTARALKKEKIDLVVASDFRRTRETAEVITNTLGIAPATLDKRFREVDTGIFEGCHDNEYHAYFTSLAEKFVKRPPRGETLRELGKRIYEGIAALEEKHHGKTILVVSHEYPIWIAEAVLRGWSEERSVAEKEARGDDFIETAGWREIPLLKLPRDVNHFADLHRPYVDAVMFPCAKCRASRDPARRDGKGTMRRVPEVIDVWYDSGAMPLAQVHYPFELVARSTKPLHPEKQIPYPADYVAEGMDQTRGWFYTLLAIATALGYPAPYKNVITFGLVNDKFGQKMSKSKGNIVEPFAVIDAHGVDAVRWYFYTGTPFGEPKNFDEGDVAKALRRMHFLVYNSFVFWNTYADKTKQLETNDRKQMENVLDRWILARLDGLVNFMTEQLDRYEVREAALAVEAFVDDLSRWYIRRSRRRFQPVRRNFGKSGKSEDDKDFATASATLRHALETLARLLAPFTPFFAEEIYQKIKGDSDPESVHLCAWPKGGDIDLDLLSNMEILRNQASMALEQRQKSNIKVRQPIASV
ncbi:MAG: class I tRNA ligase family protein, partial [Patescibacteria group bacterium]